MIMKRSTSPPLLAALLLGIAVTTSSCAASTEQFDTNTARVIHTSKTLFFSFFGLTSFKKVTAPANTPYTEIIETLLSLDGYKTKGENGIPLSVVEDYAGPVSGYQIPEVPDRPKANPLGVAASVGFAALMGKLGFYSASGVGAGAASNMIVNSGALIGNSVLPSRGSYAGEGKTGEGVQIAGDTQMVIARLCSSDNCIEVAAIAKHGDTSLDDLRRVVAEEGMPRAVGLKPMSEINKGRGK